ncbi:CAP domain-containing protein [Rhizobium sp. CFBP 8762]|uniref:CAP domain-containing protein n=1 Tax=Rhizobium sp. CFBP 8762 TaxID=2775279 RepID=UPI00177D034E|nr:CAP domain-containing protein [Rhizobium sp. CFBP 8762]MBD8553566.1 CAP domain-containing protein [Rhizobium sp. CFBP 8762]
MNRRRFLCQTGALGTLMLLAGCNTVAPPAAPGTGSDKTAETLPLINALRAKRGLPPLVADAAAGKAAQDQAALMARVGRMEHNIGLGANFHDRMKAHDVALPAGENIAAGQATTERAFLAWVNSPKHLVNMLGKSYRGLGVAMVTNPASDNKPYWAMVLSA